jgi:hypothetical protein
MSTLLQWVIFGAFVLITFIITYLICRRTDKKYDAIRSRKMRILLSYMDGTKNEWSGSCHITNNGQTMVYTYGELNIVVCYVIADDKYHGNVYTNSLLREDWSFETESIVPVGKIIKAYSILLAR